MVEADKLVNQFVIHKSCGKGIISHVEGKYLEVEFTDKGKVSKFAYPSCFYSFLVLEDGDLQREIDAVVEVWKLESGMAQKEELRHRYEKTMQGIAERRLAAEEKKLKAARRAMEHRSTYNHVNQSKKK